MTYHYLVAKISTDYKIFSIMETVNKLVEPSICESKVLSYFWARVTAILVIMLTKYVR